MSEPLLDSQASEQPEHRLPPFHIRVFQTFTAPGRLAEALAENPAWAVALLVGGLLVVAQTVLIPAEVWDAMFRETLLQQGREMPEGFDAGGTIMRVSAVVGGTIMYFVMSFLFAGIVTLGFVFLLGDEGRYKQYLASLTHAWLIPGLVGLALVPLRIAEQNPQLTLNLGTFFYFLPEGYLQKVFTMLDLSQIWAWLVVAQGAHAIDRRRSVASAAALLILISVILAMIFALFVPTL